MKMNLAIFLSSLFIISAPSLALAGSYGEAQVIGKVASVRSVENGCMVKISQFSFYRESGVHPLFAEEVLGQEITFAAYQCEGLNPGDEISGVLVSNNDTIILED